MKETLKLALEALVDVYDAVYVRSEQEAKAIDKCALAITAIKEALAQPDYRPVKTYHEGKPVYVSQSEQEPVAYFDWMPKGATHIAQIKVIKTRSGGRLEMGAYVFKYDNEVLMVYRTDNDNEYPEWIDATRVFVHTNFPVFPIPTAPPKPKPLTVDCIGLALDLEKQSKRVESQTVERAMKAAAHGLRLIEAALNIK